MCWYQSVVLLLPLRCDSVFDRVQSHEGESQKETRVAWSGGMVSSFSGSGEGRSSSGHRESSCVGGAGFH